VDVAGDGLRATIDPDDFRGGFGTWSGTSFAAPILAGEIAQQLVHTGGLKDVDLDAATERAWLAAVAVVNRGQGTLESAQPLTRPEA
jgi:subtilisin family serine protease